jgi:hypothetical protein
VTLDRWTRVREPFALPLERETLALRATAVTRSHAAFAEVVARRAELAKDGYHGAAECRRCGERDEHGYRAGRSKLPPDRAGDMAASERRHGTHRDRLTRETADRQQSTLSLYRYSSLITRVAHVRVGTPVLTVREKRDRQEQCGLVLAKRKDSSQNHHAQADVHAQSRRLAPNHPCCAGHGARQRDRAARHRARAGAGGKSRVHVHERR